MDTCDVPLAHSGKAVPMDRRTLESIVRGMEKNGFAVDGYAELHRWDLDGPWRVEFVLPQGVEPERARALLASCPHVREVESSRHVSESYSLALVVDQKHYDKHCGLRPVYSSGEGWPS